MNTQVSLLTFRINHTNLNTMLAQARREQTRTQRIDRALTLGGSIEMMQCFRPDGVGSQFPATPGRCCNPAGAQPDPDRRTGAGGVAAVEGIER